MNSKQLHRTLQGSLLNGGGWQRDLEAFLISLWLPRSCPTTGAYRDGDLWLRFDRVHTVALGFDRPPSKWPRGDSATQLSPPLHPQLADVELLDAPLGNEVRALRGDLSGTRKAAYGLGFGLDIEQEGRTGTSRAWLQIWSDEIGVFDQNGLIELALLEREVNTGWHFFYEA
ncbi:MAG: hypothetical protein AAFY60_16465, partial [Myxococcota bacterium]